MKMYFCRCVSLYFWWRDGVRDYSFELNILNNSVPTVAIRLGALSIVWR